MGRRRGGQPGHAKRSQPLLDVESCDDVIPLFPGHCRRRGEALHEVRVEPLRHQVWNVPEIRPIVTECQQHRLTCSCCGTTTAAPLPDGAPTGQSGPRLAWCWAHLKRDIQNLIDHPDRQVKRLGHDLMREVRRLFELWHRHKAGKSRWTTLRRNVRPIRDKIDTLFLGGAFSGNACLKGSCVDGDE